MTVATEEITGSAPAVISASGVTKSWGQTSVFSDLTAEVPSGVTGLLGSNGSGKTTLLGMMLGLHHPDSGVLRVLGADPAHAGAELRQRIGYSPEHHNLPPDVAAQDLVRHIAQIHGLPRRESTTRASDALWVVGLGEERARPIGTMSTGQRQRVKLAQAIAHGPALVLLDEPGAGVNPTLLLKICDMISELHRQRGYTFCLIEHDMDLISSLCDPVIVLAEGTVLTEGKMEEVRRNRQVLDAYLGGGEDE